MNETKIIVFNKHEGIQHEKIQYKGKLYNYYTSMKLLEKLSRKLINSWKKEKVINSLIGGYVEADSMFRKGEEYQNNILEQIEIIIKFLQKKYQH